MATTARPFEILVCGVKDSTGAALASGKVRWYNPGTLVAAVAYTDPACATPATAPLTLSAIGTGLLYFLEPVRVIIKDSTETTTYYDDIAALNRHDSVYITSPGINGGAETTLELFLATITTIFGSGFQYKESTAATARNYVDVIGDLIVSVKDFAAVGDGTTDDTASIQAAYDRVKARGGGWVYWPKGTYKITAAITLDTAGVNTYGAGEGVAVVKNFGTATNVFTVNLGSSTDSKMTFRNISITASTTSSGKAILFTNGNRPTIQDVNVALHRTGIDVSAVNEANITNCVVESTDDNAAAFGIKLGTRARVVGAQVISGTTNGTGIQFGTNSSAIDCYIEKFATALDGSTASMSAKGCTVASSVTGCLHSGGTGRWENCNVTSVTTAFNLGGGTEHVMFCTSTTATIGFNISGATAIIFGCACTGTTTNLITSAGAVPFVLPDLGGTVSLASTSQNVIPFRFNATTQDSVNATPTTVTPDVSAGKNVQIFGATSANVIAYTIAATTTASLTIGDILELTLWKAGVNVINITWNAQYVDPDGSALTSATVPASTMNAYRFRWNGTNWILFGFGTKGV